MSKQTNAKAVGTIGIDIGKNTLHLIGLDQEGIIVLREKLPRGRIGTRLANVPPCLIGIEGCSETAASQCFGNGARREQTGAHRVHGLGPAAQLRNARRNSGRVRSRAFERPAALNRTTEVCELD
jgi:hypothetical protein